ncbi:hypothetical protein HNR42_001312 [Deinobacterium chartae]|uniref:Uncharacterized protein n=1 Tax=Deinobacterium chartae TaxID=521158 RepID=A0A841I0D1_9DEIO|nr:hypothetical protein [Deinobacterium chartae]MBB6097889.1 hypothetical protein [Deinobacterium chartae]
MKITCAELIRWAGLSALTAGIIFAAIQPIHPPDTLASTLTAEWAVITPIKTVMCVLFLLGLTGLYTRQVAQTGRLGLVGFLLLSLSWVLQLAFVFGETFIMPLLATTAPKFVEGYLGLASGHASEVPLGALPALYTVVGVTYMLGGLVFGIATFRAKILPRWTTGLLAVASALTPLAALLPHAIQRYAAVPVGLALACMGYALWTQRQTQRSEAGPGAEGFQLPRP